MFVWARVGQPPSTRQHHQIIKMSIRSQIRNHPAPPRCHVGILTDTGTGRMPAKVTCCGAFAHFFAATLTCAALVFPWSVAHISSPNTDSQEAGSAYVLGYTFPGVPGFVMQSLVVWEAMNEAWCGDNARRLQHEPDSLLASVASLGGIADDAYHGRNLISTMPFLTPSDKLCSASSSTAHWCLGMLYAGILLVLVDTAAGASVASFLVAHKPKAHLGACSGGVSVTAHLIGTAGRVVLLIGTWSGVASTTSAMEDVITASMHGANGQATYKNTNFGGGVLCLILACVCSMIGIACSLYSARARGSTAAAGHQYAPHSDANPVIPGRPRSPRPEDVSPVDGTHGARARGSYSDARPGARPTSLPAAGGSSNQLEGAGISGYESPAHQVNPFGDASAAGPSPAVVRVSVDSGGVSPFTGQVHAYRPPEAPTTPAIDIGERPATDSGRGDEMETVSL